MGTVTDKRAAERYTPWLEQTLGRIVSITEPHSEARRVAVQVAFECAGRGRDHAHLRTGWAK